MSGLSFDLQLELAHMAHHTLWRMNAGHAAPRWSASDDARNDPDERGAIHAVVNLTAFAR
jgi:hypothetical protein